MDFTSIVFVLLSALFHPFRDLCLKDTVNPVSTYLGVVLLWVAISYSHTLIMGHSLLVPPSIWPLIALSAAGLTLYYYGTLSALRRGNLSAYYPIIRSSPLAIVIISWLLLNQSYSAITLFGIALIILSGLAIQYSGAGLLNDRKAFLLAIMAMVASAVYSIADAHAMTQVQPAPFLFYTYIIVAVMFVLIRLIEGRHNGVATGKLFGVWMNAPFSIIVAGVTSYISYYLILLAFQLGAEAAVVASIRQASIPISVILAVIFLKETRFLYRMGWACLLALGIICVAV